MFWFTTGEIIPPEWQAIGIRTSNQLVEVGKVTGRGVGNLEGQFSSVTQLCPTFCNLMNHSTPGLPVHHQLLEFTQTHVHWVGDPSHIILCPTISSSHPAISFSVVSFSSRLQSFPASGSFQMSQPFTSGGQSIGVSASTSVLPVNTQDWSPLGWT